LEHAYSCSTDLKALRKLNCSSFALCQLPRIQPNQALQTLKLKMKSGSPYGPVAIGHLIAEVFRPRWLFCRSAWAGSSDSTSSRAAQTLVSRGPDAHHPPLLVPNLCIDRLTHPPDPIRDLGVEPIRFFFFPPPPSLGVCPVKNVSSCGASELLKEKMG